LLFHVALSVASGPIGWPPAKACAPLSAKFIENEAFRRVIVTVSLAVAPTTRTSV
jgi:hypothetical protein